MDTEAEVEWDVCSESACVRGWMDGMRGDVMWMKKVYVCIDEDEKMRREYVYTRNQVVDACRGRAGGSGRSGRLRVRGEWEEEGGARGRGVGSGRRV